MKDKFYNELDAAQSKLPGHDVKLVLGDFNARVGKDPTPYHGVIGKHSFHDFATDNGNRFLDFCVFNELTVGGTLFEHKDIHKCTWYSRDKYKTRAQIDHIYVSQGSGATLYLMLESAGVQILGVTTDLYVAM